eukprot:3586113-Prorocentrum_lima.AAC.1
MRYLTEIPLHVVGEASCSRLGSPRGCRSYLSRAVQRWLKGLQGSGQVCSLTARSLTSSSSSASCIEPCVAALALCLAMGVLVAADGVPCR